MADETQRNRGVSIVLLVLSRISTALASVVEAAILSSGMSSNGLAFYEGLIGSFQLLFFFCVEWVADRLSRRRKNDHDQTSNDSDSSASAYINLLGRRFENTPLVVIVLVGSGIGLTWLYRVMIFVALEWKAPNGIVGAMLTGGGLAVVSCCDAVVFRRWKDLVWPGVALAGTVGVAWAAAGAAVSLGALTIAAGAGLVRALSTVLYREIQKKGRQFTLLTNVGFAVISFIALQGSLPSVVGYPVWLILAAAFLSTAAPGMLNFMARSSTNFIAGLINGLAIVFSFAFGFLFQGQHVSVLEMLFVLIVLVGIIGGSAREIRR